MGKTFMKRQAVRTPSGSEEREAKGEGGDDFLRFVTIVVTPFFVGSPGVL